MPNDAYVSVARVTHVVEGDRERRGHAYVYVTDYLAFDRFVPFVSAGWYAKAPLREIGDATRMGAYLQGRSIRELSDKDFGYIVWAGLGPTLAPENAVRLELDRVHPDSETQRLLKMLYSVAPLPMYPGSFVGKDGHDRACILVAVGDHDTRHHAPIRLETLEVQFDVRSLIKALDQISEGTFTIIRCRSLEPELTRYFLSVGETILRILGPHPIRSAVAHAVHRLALIFQRLQSPPTRPVNGLFGELFLIRTSRCPPRLLASWRPKDSSRFDFSSGDIRLDVKTASGRARAHTFSHDQCNPPPDTVALVASLFVERTASGLSLQELVHTIEILAANDSDLVMKLNDIVAETLGNALQEALRVQFDAKLAASSLHFYDLRAIPAIRGDPPAAVSDIHFRSDLSGIPTLPPRALIERDPALYDFLPESLPNGH
jgi:Putative  PD-(D/E)XK family member, (DUF4420)